MIATFRCEQITKETLSRLKSDKVFLSSLFLLTKVIVLDVRIISPWNLMRYFFLLNHIVWNQYYLDVRIISLVIQLISYRLGWHWEKLLRLVQNRSLGKSSCLFWKTPSPSKCTSCSLFWKAIRSACISSIQCRIKMLQSMH